MKRWRCVGYCRNVKCHDYAKGVFLFGPNTKYYCHVCRLVGHVEHERGELTGAGVVNEVRVNYCYDDAYQLYREMLVARDDGLPRGATYTMWTPLIRTEKRAAKLAEIMFVALGEGDVDAPLHEHLLSFDDDRETFKRKLAAVAQRLARNPFFQKEKRDAPIQASRSK